MELAVAGGRETFPTDRAAVGLKVQMRANVAFEVAELSGGLGANIAFENVCAPTVGLLAHVPEHSVVLSEVFFGLQATILEDDVSGFRTQGHQRYEFVFHHDAICTRHRFCAGVISKLKTRVNMFVRFCNFDLLDSQQRIIELTGRLFDVCDWDRLRS